MKVHIESILENSINFNYLSSSLVDGRQDWTAHKVELCLWAYTVANQIEPSLMEALPLRQNVQSISETSQEMKEREETSEPQSKRPKLD